jgi:acyl carrier protein
VSKDVPQNEISPAKLTSRNGRNSPSGIPASKAAVQQAWAEVLRLDNIGDTDNFFDLGGDSLKAMEVISRLQGSLKIDLPLIVFFEDPTISHLTAAADELRANELRQVEGEAGPRSAARAAVEQAWREVLRRDNFGDHDNFFDLGGDSLKGSRACSRC